METPVPKPPEAESKNSVPPATEAKLSTSAPANPIVQTVVTGTPSWVVATSLFILPPLAWFFMVRETKYHRWFIGLLLLSAGITIFTLVSFLYSLPQVALVYKSLNVKNTDTSFVSAITFFGIGFSLVQLVFALYLREVIKRAAKLNAIQLFLTIVFLLINSAVTLIGPSLVGFSIFKEYYALLQKY